MAENEKKRVFGVNLIMQEGRLAGDLKISWKQGEDGQPRVSSVRGRILRDSLDPKHPFVYNWVAFGGMARALHKLSQGKDGALPILRKGSLMILTGKDSQEWYTPKDSEQEVEYRSIVLTDFPTVVPPKGGASEGVTPGDSEVPATESQIPQEIPQEIPDFSEIPDADERFPFEE